MIFYVPLEHLDKRYTVDMDRLIDTELKKRSLPHERIKGVPLTQEIETGAFLDANSTSHFKFSQLTTIAQLFQQKVVHNGDVFFFSDIWFPGIEAIKYMALFNNLSVKVGGYCHAGSFTETDFVRELEGWVRDIEIGWFKMLDFVFVGSTFAKSELIEKKVPKYFNRIHVTGMPFDYNYVRSFAFKGKKRKEDIVVFTGRLDDEKQPWLFDKLKEKLPEYQYIKTMEQKLSKKDYYKLLARSKVVFSAALQENFGFGVIEAVTLGCIPVVPNDLSYREFFPSMYRYNVFPDAVEKVRYFMRNNTNYVHALTVKHNDNLSKAIDILERFL